MNCPTVSIIVPVLNTRPYLKQCLDSLVAQTLRDIEVICVDNGSDDGSYAVLKAFAEQDSRVRVLSHPEGRQGGARNAGLKIAKGEYIGFVDSDDFVAPVMFGRLYDMAKRDNADVAVCNITHYYKETTSATPAVPSEWLRTEGPFVIRDRPRLLRNLTICNKVFSRHYLLDHDLRFPEGIFHEDQVFVIKALILAKRIISTPDVLYFYRKGREGSVTLCGGEDNLHVFRVVQMVADFLAESGRAFNDRQLLTEVMVSRLLFVFHSTLGRARREFFKEMREHFRKTDIPAHPRVLTPSEVREFRVVRAHGYARHAFYGILRRTYGRLSASSTARRITHYCASVLIDKESA